MMTPDWIDLRLAAVRRAMPAAFAGAHVELPEIAAWCDGLRAGRPDALLLLGGVGAGKTWAAWGVWPHLITEGWVGQWRAVTEQAYLDALLPGGDRTLADKALCADLLLLDDVGAGAVSDWSRSRLLGLLDGRWSQSLPTIVTSNLPQPKLALHLGERATSRLGHHLTAVTLTGPDRRR